MDPGLRLAKNPGLGPLPAGRLLRYGAVGLATFGTYLLAGLALQQIGLPVAWLAPLAFTLAVGVNYALQKSWVFADRSRIASPLPRYLVMIGLGYAVNSLALMALAAHLPLLWAQTLAALLVTASNALLAFLWVFPNRRAP